MGDLISVIGRAVDDELFGFITAFQPVFGKLGLQRIAIFIRVEHRGHLNEAGLQIDTDKSAYDKNADGDHKITRRHIHTEKCIQASGENAEEEEGQNEDQAGDDHADDQVVVNLVKGRITIQIVALLHVFFCAAVKKPEMQRQRVTLKANSNGLAIISHWERAYPRELASTLPKKTAVRPPRIPQMTTIKVNLRTDECFFMMDPPRNK